MLEHAPTGRWLVAVRRWRSPRASLAVPRPSRTAGGFPGNGRARMASAAAPVYYCDSNYFLFGSLGGKKKRYTSKVGAGVVGRRRTRKRRLEGDEGRQQLSPVSSRPRGSQVCEPGQGDAAYCYCEVSRRTGRGPRTHTPPSGGAGAAATGTA